MKFEERLSDCIISALAATVNVVLAGDKKGKITIFDRNTG